MLSTEEVEEVLPCPIKIEICCEAENFRIAVGDSFKNLLEKHNKKYETKIEYIARHYINEDQEDTDYGHNEFKIFMGKELIYSGSGPNIFEETPELNESFYMSLILITEGILKTYHEKIIEIQEENKKTLVQYEQEQYDEMLYEYYLMRSDGKAFQYLKRLATRYPNSKYKNKLYRIYRNGLYGWHRRNRNLANKTNKRNNHEDF